jgi:hypothetical protein
MSCSAYPQTCSADQPCVLCVLSGTVKVHTTPLVSGTGEISTSDVQPSRRKGEAMSARGLRSAVMRTGPKTWSECLKSLEGRR